MDKKLLKELIKQAWFQVIAYITHYLLPIIKDALIKTKEYFISLLWETLKEEFTTKAKSAVDLIEKYFNSSDYEEKEKAAIDALMQKVNLPFLLKPFKPILKKVLKGKLKKLVEKYLKKLGTKF